MQLIVINYLVYNIFLFFTYSIVFKIMVLYISIIIFEIGFVGAVNETAFTIKKIIFHTSTPITATKITTKNIAVILRPFFNDSVEDFLVKIFFEENDLFPEVLKAIIISSFVYIYINDYTIRYSFFSIFCYNNFNYNILIIYNGIQQIH